MEKQKIFTKESFGNKVAKYFMLICILAFVLGFYWLYNEFRGDYIIDKRTNLAFSYFEATNDMYPDMGIEYVAELPGGAIIQKRSDQIASFIDYYQAGGVCYARFEYGRHVSKTVVPCGIIRANLLQKIKPTMVQVLE